MLKSIHLGKLVSGFFGATLSLAANCAWAAPGAPTNSILIANSSDSGASSSDRITNVTTPLLRLPLSGTGAVNGNSVELLANGLAMPTPQVQTLTPTNIANGYIDIIVSSGNLGADGTKVLTFRVTDNANATGPDGGALTITLDTTSPVITSIAPSSAGPSQAATETFTATFNESVYGVDASDFVLSSTGSASGTIASVTGFPGPFSVSVTGISGTGALRLDLKSSGTGIVDVAGNSIAGGYTSGGTRSVGSVAAPVPTLSEWAMILFGTILAGCAAIYVQRRRQFS